MSPLIESDALRKQREELRQAGIALRDMDLLSPVWSRFDLTPEGRGNFVPRRSYEG